MLKALIIYYSKTNTTKKFADIIDKHISADTIRVEPVDKYPDGFFATCFVGGKQLLFGERPPIKNEMPDFRKYDTIFIGSPTWASRLSVPMKTFLEKSDLSGKKIAVFSTTNGPFGSGVYKDVVKLFPNSQVLPNFLNLENGKVDSSEDIIVQWLQSNGFLDNQNTQASTENKKDEL